MQIQVVSKGIDQSEALHERVHARVTEGVEKYFNRPGEAHVSVSRDGRGFRVDCSLHLPSGALLQAKGEGEDAYGAVDAAMTRLEKRLRRYKRRLKERHGAKPVLPAETTPLFVISAQPEPDTEEEEDGAPEIEDGDVEPMIIAEQTAELPTYAVARAVSEMELTDATFLLFRNAGHGGLNAIYRRPDGHIGWLDPARERKTD
ncbi:MAG: ribosome hibernation-promoting factor, HPF/YfiA family [Maricaulaceae bacterium]